MNWPLFRALAGGSDDKLIAAFKPDMDMIEGLVAGELADDDGGRLTGPRRKQMIRNLFRGAARKALNREVAFLGECLSVEISDRPGLLALHIHALSRLQATDVLNDRLAQCETRRTHPNVAAAAVRARTLHRLFRGALDHEAYWGPIPDKLDDALAVVVRRARVTPAVTARIEAICDQRDMPMERRGSFHERFAAAASMRTYLHFLRTYREHVLHGNTAPGVIDDRMISLAEQALERRGAPDMSRPLADRDAGRGVLVAYAHQGVLRADQDMAALLPMPLTVVANDGSRFAESADAIVVNVLFGDAATGLLRAVKAGRKEPRLVLIHPDGRNGEFATRRVLGRPFRIGLGAAYLGWTGRAQTYFHRNTWRGGRQHTELARGPCAETYSDREAFTEAFLDFYAGEIERILLGPPEDIGRRLLH